MAQRHKTTVNGEIVLFHLEGNLIRFPELTEQCEDCGKDIGETAQPIKGMDDRFTCTCGAVYVGEPIPDEEEDG